MDTLAAVVPATVPAVVFGVPGATEAAIHFLLDRPFCLDLQAGLADFFQAGDELFPGLGGVLFHESGGL